MGFSLVGYLTVERQAPISTPAGKVLLEINQAQFQQITYRGREQFLLHS
jgi:hypothetical protein